MTKTKINNEQFNVLNNKQLHYEVENWIIKTKFEKQQE